MSFALAFAPQLLAYHALNGHPGPTELVARKMSWTSPHALGVLFSPEHGLFAWTPLACSRSLVWCSSRSAASRAVRARSAGGSGSIALVMVAAQVYVTGAVDSWTLQGSFGQRRFSGLTPILTLGLAALFAAPRLGCRFPGRSRENDTRCPRRVASSGGRVVSVVELGLIAQFALHRMDRQRLTLRENAWNTFVVLPREAPGILWRYFTDRSSFYGLPRH